MKRILIWLLVCMITIVPASAEKQDESSNCKSSEFCFDEFSMMIPDKYMTCSKSTINGIDGNNQFIQEFGVNTDFLTADDSIYIDAISPTTYDEIVVRLIENQKGIDFRIFNSIDEATINESIIKTKEEFYNLGMGCSEIHLSKHCQTSFFVLDDFYAVGQPKPENSTTVYCSIIKYNGKFYTFLASFISSQGNLSDSFQTDMEYVIKNTRFSEYESVDRPIDPKPNAYSFNFHLFDDIHFGDTIESVNQREKDMGSADGDIFTISEWERSVFPEAAYSQSLSYDNLTLSGIDYSSKIYHFDSNDALYEMLYEFRSGYHVDGVTLDDISLFTPAYNSIELLLRDTLGNPQYQASKKTKCDINAYSVSDMLYLLHNDITDGKVNDYSEWLLDVDGGQLKVEHVMYFTGYVYKHSVSIMYIPQ